MENPIVVTKSSGNTVPFDEQKLRQSLMKAGAVPEVVDGVLMEMHKYLYQGIPTRKLYKLAYHLLHQASRPVAARYRLKQAILELGPSGFPFEKYIAELFNREGYTVAVNQVMQGHCIKHEVDIVGMRNGHYLMVECKYHSQQGNCCEVKIPLYIRARYEDVETNWRFAHSGQPFDCEPWLVTNTRFSKDALHYGLCVGLNLLSWDYPLGKGLKDRIDAGGLYPVTCLTSLTRVNKLRLLEQGIILCESLLSHPEHLKLPGMSDVRTALVMEELSILCKTEMRHKEPPAAPSLLLKEAR
ncbi:hypothetical protein MKQ70_19880 [Chitinophaga sedimenti]|uniref:ATP cone domain-containing protein n=1 Tax=Chitinophaga sedimenti TaxID=2033606 RepID=UPI002006A20C|nr:ATP cone domain-containing protein [Chitinophaga sedimenti]MCK7557141.1 hypothetical protein [Chitinophaga sedimenti]